MNRYTPVKPLFAVIFVAPALLLTGCWDSTPIENLAYVAAIGVDSGAKPDQMMVTFGIVEPRQANPTGGGEGGGGGGGGPQEPFFYTLSVQAPSLAVAVQEASMDTPHRLFLGQMQAVVFGESLAKRGVAAVLDELWREPESRPAILLYTASHTAKEVLAVSSVLEPLPYETLLGLARNPLGYGVTNVRLSDFEDYLTEPGIDPVMPMLGVDCVQALSASSASGLMKCPGGETPELYLGGTALYRGNRLAGTLMGTASLPLRWLVGNFTGSNIAVPTPQGLVDFRLQNVRHRVWVANLRGGPRAEVTLVLWATVRGVGPEGPVMTRALLNEWQMPLARAVRALVQNSVRTALTDETDPLGLGWWMERHEPRLWVADAPGWRTELPRMRVDVSVQADIRTNGLIR